MKMLYSSLFWGFFSPRLKSNMTWKAEVGEIWVQGDQKEDRFFFLSSLVPSNKRRQNNSEKTFFKVTVKAALLGAISDC